MKDLIRKILKESEEDFSWVPKISEMEKVKDLNHKMDIAGEIIRKTRNYKGWSIYQDNFDGVVYWTRGGYTGMATPYWSEDNSIPVDISWGEDDYEHIVDIELPDFEYVVEVVDWFKNEYFEEVYQDLTYYIELIEEND